MVGRFRQPDLARDLADQLAATARSPTLHALAAYVRGEIDSAVGRPADAERHYARAVELARTSGATFVVAIASVGQVGVLAEAGRVGDALRRCAEVVD